jgi:dimethylglycine catabolism B
VSEVRPLAEVRDDAVHGSFCPKMCNHVCPVLGTTGRQGAAPWGLHVTVAALASGDRTPDAETYRDLRGCTGCHACRSACTYDLDLPREVRAARGAVIDAGVEPEAVAAARAAVHAGRAPHGGALPEAAPIGDDADVLVLVGCHDEPETVEAVEHVLGAAGRRPGTVVPDGCCGGLLADLGDRASAEERRSGLEGGLRRLLGRTGAQAVLALDPHCLPALRSAVPNDVEVLDAISFLARLVGDGDVTLAGTGATEAVAFTYHDPCVLARDEGVTGPPRELLRAVGATVAEPEGARERTSCSGAGLAFPLVDAEEADAVARGRADDLRGAGATPVTACSRARQHLTRAGLDVHDLLILIAEHVDGDPR